MIQRITAWWQAQGGDTALLWHVVIPAAVLLVLVLLVALVRALSGQDDQESGPARRPARGGQLVPGALRVIPAEDARPDRRIRRATRARRREVKTALESSEALARLRNG